MAKSKSSFFKCQFTIFGGKKNEERNYDGDLHLLNYLPSTEKHGNSIYYLQISYKQLFRVVVIVQLCLSPWTWTHLCLATHAWIIGFVCCLRKAVLQLGTRREFQLKAVLLLACSRVLRVV